MAASEVILGLIAIIIGYLLGSIPSAYLITRLTKKADIRRLGGGNVGGLNVFREVGPWPALAVGLTDLGKGAAAVAIAYWLLAVPDIFVPLAGIAAVVGHNWMLFLKFSGGKGMGPAIGVLAVLMPLYGYWPGLPIFFGVVLIPFIFTRNVALSMLFGLIALPFIIGLGMRSGIGAIMAVILGLIIGLKFLPTFRAALAKSKTKSEFVFDRWQSGERKED
jgi:glycerol-3-phosphate acyltransferase PlsY